MAALTIQTTSQAGITPTYAAAAAGGDTVVNNGRVVLHVKNGYTSPQTVTIASKAQATVGLARADRSVAVPNASERIIGPFEVQIWNNDTGQIELTYSGVTSLTIAAIQIP